MDQVLGAAEVLYMRARWLVSLGWLLLGLSFASPATAAWRSHAGANVRFYIPDGWVESARGQVLTIRPATPGLAVQLVPLRSAVDVQTAGPLIDSVLQGQFQNARRDGAPRQLTHNGMQGIGANGSAMDQGRPIEWISVVLLSDRSHGVIVLGFAAQGQFAAHRPMVQAILNSIQPMGATNVMPFAGTATSTMILTSAPGIPPETRARPGHVAVTDNGGGNVTIALLSETGGPPCLLRASRAVATTAAIAPGQTCSTTNPAGVAISFTATGGTATFSGNSVVLSVSGAVVAVGPRGSVSGTMTYQFSGMHP